MTRRWFVKSLLLGSLVAGCLGISMPVEARGRRVRFGGRGIRGRGHYSQNVLTQDQLKTCLTKERHTNTLSAEVDQDAADLNEQERRVDLYSQSSVDAFNRRVHNYNAKVQQLQSAVNEFNALCADKGYYESDMQAAKNFLGYK